MKKIDLGQSLSILANVGVLIGIVFLAIEVRDSNVQARVVNTIAFVGQSTDWLLNVANDPDSSRVYVRGMSNYAELSDEDKVRFDFIMRAILGRYSASTAASSADLGVGGYGFEAQNIRIFFEQEGFRQWWAAMDRRSLPLHMVRLVEQIEASASERL
jgi:hypothetical protein